MRFSFIPFRPAVLSATGSQSKRELKKKTSKPSVFARATALLLVPISTMASAQESSRVPALEVVAPNGVTSILIGSLHVAVMDLPQPAYSVMNGVTRYVVEGRPKPGLASSASEQDPEVSRARSERAHWTTSLSAPDIQLLRERIQCNIQREQAPIDSELVLRYALTRKSAQIAAGFATMPCGPIHLRSRDEILAGAARDRGLELSALETAEEVEKRRNRVPERIYRHWVSAAAMPSTQAGFSRVVSALAKGDYAGVRKAQRELAKTQADFEKFDALMIAGRNRAWMDALTRYLSSGPCFVNVGAAHLPGKQGLIALLRQRGYKINAVVLKSSST